MKDLIVVRINEHQNTGIQEYSVEISVPGKYSNSIIGTSQVELMVGLINSYQQIFTLFDIPQTTPSIQEPELPAATTHFFNEHGDIVPVNGFAATAKANFSAEVYRNGKLVEE